MTVVHTAELRDGYAISRIIKGGWQLAGGHGTVDIDRAIEDMVEFAKAGVTTFDCADIYIGVEDMIGRFLVELGRSLGAHAVSAIKVHTKYVPDRNGLSTLAFRDVERAVDRSLTRLGVERLDMVQFHWWDYAIPGHLDAIGHLDQLRQRGKVELIGVTNFDAQHLSDLCEVTDIAAAQVQYSLLDKRASGVFADTARANNVSLVCYGTLAGGFLTDAWLGQPDPGFELGNRSLTKYRLIIDEFGGWPLFQDLLAALKDVGNRHRVDIATVALAATLDSPDVAAAIIGARYATHLQKTLRAFRIELSKEDRRALDNVLDRRTGPYGAVYEIEREVAGRHGKIMKYNLNNGDDSRLGDRSPDRRAL